MGEMKAKKLLKVGNSYAVVLPKEFVEQGELREVFMDVSRDSIYITRKIQEDAIIREASYFGEYGGGPKDLARNHKKYYKKGLNEKYRAD